MIRVRFQDLSILLTRQMQNLNQSLYGNARFSARVRYDALSLTSQWLLAIFTSSF